MEYLLHILILISIYAIVGMALNLVAGYTGLISLSHAGFYGIGAYTAALLSLNYGVHFLLVIPAAVLIAVIVGFLIGFPALRIRDDFFVIATFGFQIILFQVMNNWMDLTNGPLGLPGIPQPELFGYHLTSHIDFLVLSLAFAAIVYFILRRLTRSPFGNVLRAIREDDVFALSLGKNVNLYKVTSFSVAAGLGCDRRCDLRILHYIYRPNEFYCKRIHLHALHRYRRRCGPVGRVDPGCGHSCKSAGAFAVCRDAKLHCCERSADIVRRGAGCVHDVETERDSWAVWF